MARSAWSLLLLRHRLHVIVPSFSFSSQLCTSFATSRKVLRTSLAVMMTRRSISKYNFNSYKCEHCPMHFGCMRHLVSHVQDRHTRKCSVLLEKLSMNIVTTHKRHCRTPTTSNTVNGEDDNEQSPPKKRRRSSRLNGNLDIKDSTVEDDIEVLKAIEAPREENEKELPEHTVDLITKSIATVSTQVTTRSIFFNGEDDKEQRPPKKRRSSSRLSSNLNIQNATAVDDDIEVLKVIEAPREGNKDQLPKPTVDLIILSGTTVSTQSGTQSISRSKFTQIDGKIEGDCLVFFDLETGGMSNKDEILEIAAMHKQSKFNVYCTPTQKISPFASRVNKLTCKEGELYYKGALVSTVPLRDGLYRFLKFLQDLPQAGSLVLVGHNVKFDSRFLLNGLGKLSIHHELGKYVVGFLDTLPMYKRHFPRCDNHKQNTLVNMFMERESLTDYNSHNALSDVIYMVKLFNLKLRPLLNNDSISEFSYTLESAIAKNEFISGSTKSQTTAVQRSQSKSISQVTESQMSILKQYKLDDETAKKLKEMRRTRAAGDAIGKIISMYRNPKS